LIHKYIAYLIHTGPTLITSRNYKLYGPQDTHHCSPSTAHDKYQNVPQQQPPDTGYTHGRRPVASIATYRTVTTRTNLKKVKPALAATSINFLQRTANVTVSDYCTMYRTATGSRSQNSFGHSRRNL